MFFYNWYHLTFILQVPYKKVDKNIYIYIFYDIFVTGGEQSISIFVITQFLQGEKNITYFLQGEHMCTQRVIIKKGENVGTCFDEDFVKHFIWSSNTRLIKSSS